MENVKHNIMNANPSWPEAVRGAHEDVRIFIDPNISPNVYSWYQARTKMVVALVKKFAPNAKNILDIGCAQGSIALELGRQGYTVTGNDIRKHYVDYANIRNVYDNVKFVCDNFMEYAPDELYDVITLTEVIEHVAEHQSFLENVRKRLVPGGILIITTPNYHYFRESLPSFSELKMDEHLDKQFSADGSDHFYLFKKDELIALLGQCGFAALDHAYYLPFIQYGCFKSALLWKLLPLGLMEAISGLFDKSKVLCAQQYGVFQSTAVAAPDTGA